MVSYRRPYQTYGLGCFSLTSKSLHHGIISFIQIRKTRRTINEACRAESASPYATASNLHQSHILECRILSMHNRMSAKRLLFCHPMTSHSRRNINRGRNTYLTTRINLRIIKFRHINSRKTCRLF